MGEGGGREGGRLGEWLSEAKKEVRDGKSIGHRYA